VCCSCARTLSSHMSQSSSHCWRCTLCAAGDEARGVYWRKRSSVRTSEPHVRQPLCVGAPAGALRPAGSYNPSRLDLVAPLSQAGQVVPKVVAGVRMVPRAFAGLERRDESDVLYHCAE
jgi:hypothetical protein